VRRRRVLAAATGCAGLASLAGCGGSDEEEKGGTGGGDGTETDTAAEAGTANGTPGATTGTPAPDGNLGPELVVVNRDTTTYRVVARVRPEEGGESVFEEFVSVPGGTRVEREVAFDGPGTYLAEVRIRSEEASDRWTVEAADPRAAVVVTIENGSVTFGRRTPGE
jgi:hypothetical protein